MNPVVAAILVAIALLAAAGAASYNRFHRQRNGIQQAWRQIDAELRRRYDLIPGLVEIAKGYAVHERQVLDAVTNARVAAATPSKTVADQARDENALTGAMREMYAVAQSYPQLRGDQHFLMLQGQLAATEDRIAAGRQIYNANVRAYNSRVAAFPTSLIAAAGHFEKAEHFEVTDAAAGLPPPPRPPPLARPTAP